MGSSAVTAVGELPNALKRQKFDADETLCPKKPAYCMNNKKLLADFTRAVKTPDGPCLECLTISWPHPSTPKSRWKKVKLLPADSTAEEIGSAQRLLLKDPRYFGVCKMCHERNPMGWMCGKDVCQACAVDHLGVVF